MVWALFQQRDLSCIQTALGDLAVKGVCLSAVPWLIAVHTLRLVRKERVSGYVCKGLLMFGVVVALQDLGWK